MRACRPRQKTAPAREMCPYLPQFFIIQTWRSSLRDGVSDWSLRSRILRNAQLVNVAGRSCRRRSCYLRREKRCLSVAGETLRVRCARVAISRTEGVDVMQTNPELTPEVLDELRQKLEQKRRGLRAAINREQQREGVGDTEFEDPTEDAPGDSGDSSVDLQAWDTGHQTLVDLQADLGEVEHALAKFDQGTYGL